MHSLPTAVPAALLAHAEFLRTLSRALVRDRDAQDDLVQDAWVAALEQQSADSAANRSWLAGVVRNLAWKRRRSALRRSDREAMSAREEATESASVAIERTEVLAQVTAAVLALDPPYRDTILARYYEGLELTQLAERHGLPLATIRSRHQRALAQLRERLDRANGGDRRVWIGGLIEFAGPTAAVSTVTGGAAGATWTTVGITLMNKKLVSIVLAISLLLLGVLWFSSSDPRAGQTERGARTAGLSEHAEDSPSPGEGQEELSKGPPTSGRSVPTSSVVAVTEPVSGVELIAVVGALQRPALDAEMWWWNGPSGSSESRPHVAPVRSLPSDTLEDLFRAALESGALTELLAREAVALKRDARDRFFAPVEGAGVAVARSGDHWGYRTLVSRAGGAAQRIVLEREVAVAVRVLQPSRAGAPRVHVALVADDYVYGQCLTDADGNARLEQLRALVWGDWNPTQAFELVIAEPLGQHVGCRVDLPSAPGGGPEFVLPATARVEVEMPDPPREAWVSMQARPRSAGAALDSDTETSGWKRPVIGSRAVFEYVGLDCELTVEYGYGDAQATGRIRVDGPRVGDAVLHVRVPAPVLRARFVARLVRPGGMPVAESRVEARGLADDLVGTATSLCDATGRVEFELAPSLVGSGRLMLTVHGPDGRRSKAECAVANFDAPSPIDLGAVDLVDVAVAFAGRVIDEKGAPAAGAEVALFREQDADPEAGPAEPRRGWIVAAVRSDSDGSFAIQLDDPAKGAFALRAARDERTSEWRDAVRGERNMTLALDGWSAACVGRIVLPPAIAPDFIDLVFTLEDASHATPVAHGRSSFRLDANGEFLAPGLSPGTYQVSIGVRGSDHELGTVRRVVLEAGRTVRDPRLDPFEVRDVGLVWVLDDSGTPVADVRWCRAADSKSPMETVYDGTRLVVDRRAPPLWISADEYMIERLDPSSGVTEVRLRRAQEIWLRLHPDLEQARAGLDVWGYLCGGDEPPGLGECAPDAFELNPREPVRGWLRRAGKLRARLTLEGSSKVLLDVDVLRIDVSTENGALAMWQIECDADRFAKACARARL